jgi:hypothetical protein
MIIERKVLGMVQSVLGFQGDVMSQLSFSDVEYGAKRKKTKREIFLAEMDSIVPWDSMIKLIESVYPQVWCGQTCLCLAFYAAGVLLATVVRIERPCDGRGAI